MTGNEVNETAVEAETEKTAEATAEQTAEATAEQTAEATAEQTAEATAEQTAEATAEQTAEATAEQTAEATTEPAPGQKTVRKVFGRVVTNGADKTVAVSIERVVKHPVYGKYIRRTTKVLAHDEDNACEIGDRVAIAECRPLSKRKSWRVVEVFAGNGAPQ